MEAVQIVVGCGPLDVGGLLLRSGLVLRLLFRLLGGLLGLLFLGHLIRNGLRSVLRFIPVRLLFLRLLLRSILRNRTADGLLDPLLHLLLDALAGDEHRHVVSVAPENGVHQRRLGGVHVLEPGVQSGDGLAELHELVLLHRAVADYGLRVGHGACEEHLGRADVGHDLLDHDAPVLGVLVVLPALGDVPEREGEPVVGVHGAAKPHVEDVALPVAHETAPSGMEPWPCMKANFA